MTSADAPLVPWHIGLAVDDLDQAMAELGGALRLTWGKIHHFSGQTQGATPDEVFDIETRVCFSLDLPFSVELFEQVPGTPLEAPTDSTFHHLGYWTDDMAGEERRLDGIGFPCFGKTPGADGQTRIALHRGPSGIVVESCNIQVGRPGLEHFLPR
ncbi:VOC family protein [Streptomyces sp. NPDC057137]|uniref:VOC family protein n=1 Tax=Streptomyces sp. NPDC057137 TaxID=3346030 RepID=UPI00362EA1FC